MLFPFVAVLGFGFLYDARNRFGSNGVCFRHRAYTARPIFASRIAWARTFDRFLSCRCIHAFAAGKLRNISDATSPKAHFKWALPIFFPADPLHLAGTLVDARHQPTVTEEVADLGKTPDVVDLVQQS